MQSNLPQKYKAVVIEGPGQKPKVGEFDLPVLTEEGQLLIKVEAAPLNPSDVLKIQGTYPMPNPWPYTPGIEGAGLVVAVKGKEAEQKFMGKRVSFYSDSSHFTGTYGEYCVSNTNLVVPIGDDITYEQGATQFINPYTVVCMYNLVKRNNVKTVIHTAAASQLGRMMVRYFNSNGVEVINVVRKQEQVEVLQKLGAKYIINQNDEGFVEKLRKLAAELNATIAFESVGGELTGLILDALPDYSTCYLYGNLSGEQSRGINFLPMLRRTLTGFGYSYEFAPGKSDPAQVAKTVNELLNTTFKTDIGQDFSFEHINEALEYYKQNATKGKPLIKYNGKY